MAAEAAVLGTCNATSVYPGNAPMRWTCMTRSLGAPDLHSCVARPSLACWVGPVLVDPRGQRHPEVGGRHAPSQVCAAARWCGMRACRQE
eukprot:6021032-Alexandrium_andersonii.AAC.1